MVRGLYSAESGMLAQLRRMDVIANNLANAGTAGYKRQNLVFKSFPEMLLRQVNGDGVVSIPSGSYDLAPYVGKLGTGVSVNQSYLSFEQGHLKNTGNKLDLALKGNGFFVLKTPLGDQYSRQGNFLIDQDGYVVTSEGFRLQGEKGDIRLQHFNFRFDKDGGIWRNPEYNVQDLSQFTDDEHNEWRMIEAVDQIKLVHFYDPQALKRVGSGLYRETEFSGEPLAQTMDSEYRAEILSGFEEASNVRPVEEMTSMIEVQRAYEVSQKAIGTHDILLEKAVNRMAEV